MTDPIDILAATPRRAVVAKVLRNLHGKVFDERLYVRDAEAILLALDEYESAKAIEAGSDG